MAIRTDWFDALGKPVSEHGRRAALDLLVAEGYDAGEAAMVLTVVAREIEHDQPAQAMRYMESFVGRRHRTMLIRTLATLTAPQTGDFVDDLTDLMEHL